MIGIFITAWADVFARPSRTIASVLGMVAAIAAVVVVDAAGTLSNSAAAEYLAQQYGRPATLRIDAKTPVTPDTLLADDARLTTALTDNGISQFSVFAQRHAVLVDGDRHAEGGAAIVSPSYASIRIITLRAGAFPQATAHSAALHAVIDTTVAESLGYQNPAHAVGRAMAYAFTNPAAGLDLVTASMRPVVIDAVMNPLPGVSSSASILLVTTNLEPAWAVAGKLSWVAHVDSADAKAAESVINNLTVPSDPASQQFISLRTDQDDQLAPVLDQQSTTTRAVSLVALTVGGLGILGVGLASVRERARDFALRRAIGADPPHVFASVLLQAVLEICVAAFIAVPVAAIVVAVLPRELVLPVLPAPTHVSLPIGSVVRGTVTALVVGLLAGLLPAFRAARASVVQALRD